MAQTAIWTCADEGIWWPVFESCFGLSPIFASACGAAAAAATEKAAEVTRATPRHYMPCSEHEALQGTRALSCG